MICWHDLHVFAQSWLGLSMFSGKNAIWLRGKSKPLGTTVFEFGHVFLYR